MEKEKLRAIVKVIMPDEEDDPMNEDFSNGWNSCREKLEEKLEIYLETLD